MRDGECPKCRSHEVFVSTWPGGVSAGADSLYVVTDAADSRDEGRFYACVACGYVEHYFDENARARIAASPNGRSWSRVVPPGWHSDPTGRHELRYWDGLQWSSRVRDAERESEDSRPI